MKRDHLSVSIIDIVVHSDRLGYQSKTIEGMHQFHSKFKEGQIIAKYRSISNSEFICKILAEPFFDLRFCQMTHHILGILGGQVIDNNKKDEKHSMVKHKSLNFHQCFYEPNIILYYIFYRYNLSHLEQWLRDSKLQESGAGTALEPIVQASQLLQARKTEADVESVCDMCSKLTIPQVRRIKPQGYKTLFMFNSTEHEITTAHKN